jgi:metallo-beta-lactamase class B
MRLPSAQAFALSLCLMAAGSAVAQHAHDHGSESRELPPRDDPAVQHVAPFQVFDNLYYVGADWVAAWLLKTSDGLILIDSLYGELLPLIEEGIVELGFDPADIRYVLVTHAHFDHAGGAKRFQDKYGATVGMVEEDWQLAAGKPDFRAYPRPQKQMVIKDGDKLTLGDTTVTFYHTPGHTLGVTSMQFTVYDQGRPHQAFVMGGAGLNFRGKARVQAYTDSLERIKGMQGIEVNISNHASSGDVFERAKALDARQPGQAHPFVDPAAFQDWLEQLLSNGRKQLAQEQ